jgi:hypothetical protein
MTSESDVLYKSLSKPLSSESSESVTSLQSCEAEGLGQAVHFARHYKEAMPGPASTIQGKLCFRDFLSYSRCVCNTSCLVFLADGGEQFINFHIVCFQIWGQKAENEVVSGLISDSRRSTAGYK